MQSNTNESPAAKIWHTIQHEQSIVDNLEAQMKEKKTLLANKSKEHQELVSQNLSKESELHDARNEYSKVAEKANALDDLLKEEKDKQYKLHVELTTTEEDVAKAKDERSNIRIDYARKLATMNRQQMEAQTGFLEKLREKYSRSSSESQSPNTDNE